MKTHKTTLLAIAAFLSLIINGQNHNYDSIANWLDSSLTEVSKTNQIPGFSVGLVSGKSIVYTGAFGISNLKDPKPVSSKSIFQVASISKTFVSIAIMQLEEDGKLNLNDKVMDHLPYFKMKDSRYKEITIQYLLCHSSGLPHYRGNPWHEEEKTKPEIDKLFAKFYKKKLKFDPGNGYQYSNLAFILLGDIIVKKSSISFTEYMKQNVLTPLEMNKSSFDMSDIDKNLNTHSHIPRFLFWKTKTNQASSI